MNDDLLLLCSTVFSTLTTLGVFQCLIICEIGNRGINVVWTFFFNVWIDQLFINYLCNSRTTIVPHVFVRKTKLTDTLDLVTLITVSQLQLLLKNTLKISMKRGPFVNPTRYKSIIKYEP